MQALSINTTKVSSKSGRRRQPKASSKPSRHHRRGASYSELFRNGPSDRQLRYLYDTFLAPGAPWRLEFTADVKFDQSVDKVKRRAEAGLEWNLEMYDEVATLVSERICRSTYMRWRTLAGETEPAEVRCKSSSFIVEEWI